MAVTVIVETGQNIANSNSYVSIATIDDWILTNPHDSTWDDLIDVKKNGYAVMSCRVLNEQMDWNGWQISDDQALDLPRSGLTDKNGNFIDNDEIPAEVQNAQCELARLLAISDRTADFDTAGFSQIKIAEINLVIDKTDRTKVMPDAVWNMISAFGNKKILKGVVHVIRT